MDDPVRNVALADGRYSPEAFRFLFESLETSVRIAGKGEAEGSDRHVTGQELVAGLREHAANAFGPLAAHVWRSWGVKRVLDWGHIVFLLVEGGMLNSQPTDTLEDFRGEFDFDEAFVKGYSVPTELVDLEGR